MRDKHIIQPVRRVYDGKRFDSGAELVAYKRLQSMPDRVKNLEYHPKPIILWQGDVAIAEYRPDFSYYDEEIKKQIIVELKGISFWNDMGFKMKMKMLGASNLEIDIFILQSAQVKYWCTSTMLAQGFNKLPVNFDIPRQNIFGAQLFLAGKNEYL